jgi:hypothetical protein
MLVGAGFPTGRFCAFTHLKDSILFEQSRELTFLCLITI